MTNTRFFAALCACALAGCVSPTDETTAGAQGPSRAFVRISAERGGAELPMSDADVNKFSSRIAAHAAHGRTACVRELVRDTPDLALEAFRRPIGRTDAESAALRQAIATAWEEAFGESALREGESARREHAAEASKAIDLLVEGLNAKVDGLKLAEAAAAFRTLGDPFWAEECSRLTASRGIVLDGASRPAPSLVAQAGLRTLESARAAALARRWPEVRGALPSLMDSTLKRRDLALAADIEDLRAQPEIAAAFGVEETHRWLVGLGTLALDRGLHLLALRCAMTARDLAPAGIDNEGRDAARRLFARAAAARGDLPLAFRAAESLFDEARAANQQAAEASAAALCAEILLAEDRAKEAAGMYLHAAGIADSLSMAADAARNRLGAAGAFLSAGMLAPCGQELQKVTVAAGATGRRARFATALLSAASRDKDSARKRIGNLLVDSESAGDYTLVEKCEAASGRLE